MGRQARFDRQTLLMTVAEILAAGLQATIQAVAERSGAPVGSIYHRFASREEMLAEAWLMAVADFQAAFLPPLRAAQSLAEGEEAALSVPRWARAQPALAGFLLLRRQGDLLSRDTPVALRRRAALMNREVGQELDAFALRIGRSKLLCRMGLVAVPYGAVRLFLPDKPPPAEIDELIRAAYRGVMTARY